MSFKTNNLEENKKLLKNKEKMFDITFPTPETLNKYRDDDDSVNKKILNDEEINKQNKNLSEMFDKNLHKYFHEKTNMIFETSDLTIYIFIFHFILELMMIFKEILKASRNNQASIFAFTFKIKSLLILIILPVMDSSPNESTSRNSPSFSQTINNLFYTGHGPKPSTLSSKCIRKMTTYSCHISFLKTCSDHDLIPRGLRLKDPIGNSRSESTLHDTSLSLLKQRLNHYRTAFIQQQRLLKTTMDKL